MVYDPRNEIECRTDNVSLARVKRGSFKTKIYILYIYNLYTIHIPWNN